MSEGLSRGMVKEHLGLLQEAASDAMIWRLVHLKGVPNELRP